MTVRRRGIEKRNTDNNKRLKRSKRPRHRDALAEQLIESRDSEAFLLKKSQRREKIRSSRGERERVRSRGERKAHTPGRRIGPDAHENEAEEEAGETAVGGALGEKILRTAREQLLELEEDERGGGVARVSGKQQAGGRRGDRRQQAIASSVFDLDDDDDDDDNGEIDEFELDNVDGDDEDGGDGIERPGGGEDEDEQMAYQVTEEDEAALAAFGDMRFAPAGTGEHPEARKRDDGDGGGGVGGTLADMILAKIREAERAGDPSSLAAAGAGGADGAPSAGSRYVDRFGVAIDPQVLAVYRGVGRLMKTYKSGKVPKAFKLMPALRNWEDIMWLTRPDEWSPAAVFVATRVFVSNLNPRAAQRFFNLVLLPRCREDISANKRLNCHLYQALKKATYKPQAFYKGIILPLAEDECTLREATIFGSAVAKATMPMLHSAAALLFLAKKPYAGPVSLLIRVLLDKKYALPHKAIDALVEHFVSVEHDSRELPVLWHQSLLAFAQRYKTDVTREQKEQLKRLMRTKFHYLITPEVRRELFSVRSRGESVDPDANSIARTLSEENEQRARQRRRPQQQQQMEM